LRAERSNPEKTTRRLNTTLKHGLPRGFQPLAMTQENIELFLFKETTAAS
jgi:hypothetical protein